MGTIAISGCATGIGAASREALEREGWKAVGIDIKDAEVIADLSTASGRQEAAREVLERCEGVLDGVLLCAGLGGHIDDNSRVASVNYFGVVELLDALFPALRKGTNAAGVVICSNSAQLSPTIGENTLVKAMLDGDEAEARRLADEEYGGQLVYMSSKNAVGRAVRRRALEWGEAGVRLNAIAPGPIETPLLAGGLAAPDGDAIRNFKVPLGRFGETEEMARVIRFLLSEDASYVHGSVWYADGGADANVRPESF